MRDKIKALKQERQLLRPFNQGELSLSLEQSKDKNSSPDWRAIFIYNP